MGETKTIYCGSFVQNTRSQRHGSLADEITAYENQDAHSLQTRVHRQLVHCAVTTLMHGICG